MQQFCRSAVKKVVFDSLFMLDAAVLSQFVLMTQIRTFAAHVEAKMFF
jgi:hypothetical protein